MPGSHSFILERETGGKEQANYSGPPSMVAEAGMGTATTLSVFNFLDYVPLTPSADAHRVCIAKLPSENLKYKKS